MRIGRTGPRGLLRGRFVDRNGKKCSIQASSLATEAAIWLGIDEVKVKILGSTGWQDVPLPEEAQRMGRMHLTQKMVKKLLPALQYFVKTGYLPHSSKRKK
jgi:hypothetical protein